MIRIFAHETHIKRKEDFCTLRLLSFKTECFGARGNIDEHRRGQRLGYESNGEDNISRARIRFHRRDRCPDEEFFSFDSFHVLHGSEAELPGDLLVVENGLTGEIDVAGSV